LARTEAVRLNNVLSRVETSAEQGLSAAQARERLENGYANIKPESAEKTIGQVFMGHIFTYFNLVFFLLGLCTLFWGSIGNIFFINVVIINTVIGIVQELRSKRALAKLSFITAPNATVIRDGNRMTIPTDKTVLDDIVVFSAEQQIYADAIVLSGECHVNEAMVTGESDEITKTSGDMLLSGSFVVSGECVARLDKVGRDSFVAQLTLAAKKTRNKLSAGGMVSSIKRLVQIIGIIIVPNDEVSATTDPETAPKNLLESTLTIAKPPLSRPTSTSARSSIRLAMPPSPMMLPAMMKKGIARKLNGRMPETSCCATIGIKTGL